MRNIKTDINILKTKKMMKKREWKNHMCSAVNDNYVMNVIKSLNKYAKRKVIESVSLFY